MDTYYEENKRIFSPLMEKIKAAGNGRKAIKAASAFFEAVHEREAGCLICSRMDERLLRYAYTIASLWRDDQDFRAALNASKGLCLHHTEAVMRVAEEALSGDDLASFCRDMIILLEKNLARVQHDDWWMTQKYKSENKDKPWNGAEDAHKRAVLKLIGEGRVIDPVKK